MGSRGNIVVLDGHGTTGPQSTGVVLYTHWGGHRVQRTLARALKRSDRLADVDYFTRQLFVDLMLDSYSDDDRYGRDLLEVTPAHYDAGYHPETIKGPVAPLLQTVLETTGYGIGTRVAGDVEYDGVAGDVEYDVPVYLPRGGIVAVVPVDEVDRTDGTPGALANLANQLGLWESWRDFAAGVLDDPVTLDPTED